MPRRFRRGFRRTSGGPKLRYEWTGFRDGGTAANLNTSTAFELVPPDGTSSVINLLPRIRRVVGTIGFSLQGSVTSATPVGAVLALENVGRDQVIDAGVEPLSTDADSFGLKQILWWQTWRDMLPEAGTTGEWDEMSKHYEIDVKLNRPMKARDTLILRIDAATTARARVSVNLRCLVQVHAQ